MHGVNQMHEAACRAGYGPCAHVDRYGCVHACEKCASVANPKQCRSGTTGPGEHRKDESDGKRDARRTHGAPRHWEDRVLRVSDR